MKRSSRKIFGVPVVRRAGVTLLELMVATALISIGILGMVGTFKYINQAIQGSKGKSLANNLAQEKIEVLKNKSYYRVLVTTATTVDNNFSPAITYDAAPNAPETLNVGGINFERRVYIRKVSENASGDLEYQSWTSPDTGLKEVLVYVVWKEGSTWKKAELRNLRDNPNRANLSATFSGTVTDAGSGNPIQDATVRAQENPARYGETSASGNYSFAIEPGSYTLLASKTGYFASKSPLYIIATTVNHGFQLPAMSSGTVRGTAWLRDHLVISQVVGSSVNSSAQYQEWVEVFNPTTWTWTMATGLGTGANEVVKFSYKESAETKITPDIDYRAAAIAPGSYFLFANTGTITAAGFTRAADAVYSSDADFFNIDDMIKTGNPSSGGYIVIGDNGATVEYDLIAWDATANGNAAKREAERYEGNAIEQSIGFQEGEEYTRRSASGGITAGQGRCYDTADNDDDFIDTMPIANPPRNSSVSEACVSGAPAAGAVVFAGDGLSNPVIAVSTGAFDLVGVATGTWNIYISSGLVLSTRAITGASAGFSTAMGDVVLASANVYGYVTGTVTDIAAAPLPSIIMYAGGFQAITNSAGGYTLPVYPGEISVTANYQTASPTYVEISSIGVAVSLGQVTKNVNFVLEKGGKIRGWVTTNGTDPLPNIPVTATEGGVEKGSGISGSDGYYLIWGSGISTGTYAVTPQLESGESADPSSHTVTVSAGQTIFAGTAAVSGAMGYISGSLTASTAAITTGVLIYATTGTIAGSPVMPPAINSTLRGGSVIYYAVSGNASGRYTLAVRGGYTYNVYAWYTTWRGETPVTNVRQFSGVAVSAGQSVTRDFVW